MSSGKEFQSRQSGQQRQMPDVHRYWAGAVEQRLYDYWQNVAVDDRQRRMLMSIRYRGALLCWYRRISIPNFLGFNWMGIQNVHRFHQAYRNPLYCTCWQWIFRRLMHLYWPACNWRRRRCSYEIMRMKATERKEVNWAGVGRGGSFVDWIIEWTELSDDWQDSFTPHHFISLIQIFPIQSTAISF